MSDPALDPAFAALRSRYLERRRDDVPRLRALLAEGDFASIIALGHRLKGSGASYGFDGVSAIGRALEQAGEAEDRAAVEEATARLASFLTDD